MIMTVIYKYASLFKSRARRPRARSIKHDIQSGRVPRSRHRPARSVRTVFLLLYTACKAQRTGCISLHRVKHTVVVELDLVIQSIRKITQQGNHIAHTLAECSRGPSINHIIIRVDAIGIPWVYGHLAFVLRRSRGCGSHCK